MLFLLFSTAWSRWQGCKNNTREGIEYTKLNITKSTRNMIFRGWALIGRSRPFRHGKVKRSMNVNKKKSMNVNKKKSGAGSMKG